MKIARFPLAIDMMLFIKNLLFIILVPGTAAVLVPLLIARGHAPVAGAWLLISLPLLVVGAVIYVWCVADFAIYGRGTPAPIDAPRELVVRGPYRHIRNPMYTSMLAMFLGWAAFFQLKSLLLYWLLAVIVINLVIIFYEEPHLKKIFGDSYLQYQQRAGRWLPRTGRNSAGRQPSV